MVFRCPSCKEKVRISDVAARDLPTVTCGHCKSVFETSRKSPMGKLREANPALYGGLGIAVVLFLVRLLL